MSAHSRLFTPILIGGSLILLINFALRASFGVFQIPIAADFGWPRAEFSLAIAIQNLAWGIGQPVFGAAAGQAMGVGERDQVGHGSGSLRACAVFMRQTDRATCRRAGPLEYAA